MGGHLIDLPAGERDEFSFRPLVSKHRIHELNLVGDDELIALLDAYPRERLQAFTMGTDRCHRDDWHYVDASAASGKEIFTAVIRGRLWLNLLRVDLVDRRYGDVIRQITADLQDQCKRLGLLSINFGTLLISSPNAMVYYHFDANHQALWHLRGSKRIWLYPACDERFASREIMEEIFTGTYDYDEEIPYEPEFDQHAVVYQLEPGDVVSWPQNAPHRIENLDTLNVSLSTGFVTEAADRRHLIYSANHLLRRRFGLPTVSTREAGLAASAKCLAYRMFRRAGWLPKGKGATRSYPKNLRVDPAAPLGFSAVTR
ncbi:MAG TPA: hypothetical protein VF653_21145, partial [Methylomirabilota bacterium]